MKYVETKVVFEEVPDEITLAINISNCPVRCEGCHSPHLWQDIGTELTDDELRKLIKANQGITCVAIMGGDGNFERLYELFKVIKEFNLKSCWYSGRNTLFVPMKEVLDYVKFGPYIEEFGGLDKPKSNQRFFKIVGDDYEDLTYKFKAKKNEIKN